MSVLLKNRKTTLLECVFSQILFRNKSDYEKTAPFLLITFFQIIFGTKLNNQKTATLFQMPLASQLVQTVFYCL